MGVCVCARACACACAYVPVRVRERVCVCVCVCVYDGDHLDNDGPASVKIDTKKCALNMRKQIRKNTSPCCIVLEYKHNPIQNKPHGPSRLCFFRLCILVTFCLHALHTR